MRQLLGFCLVILWWAGRAAGGDLPTQVAIRAARDKVFPALVHIQAVKSYFRKGRKVQQVSVGSGVIIDARGHVATNYHVVSRAKKVLCTLSDKTRAKATVVGGDPWTDLAVVRLNRTALQGRKVVHADFGSMKQVQAGDYVLAMGSPLSLSRSVSLGIISCADRYLPAGARLPTGEPTGRFNTWIQTDAAINPGNSGGPLVTLDGRIVGINSRAAKQASNIGFAIPVDVVKAITTELIRRRRVRRSSIGVTLQPLKGIGGAGDEDAAAGVVISGVAEGSPAAAIGLRPGDVMRSFNGRPTNAPFQENVPEVYRRIAATPLGKPVELVVQRDGETLTLSVKAVPLGETQSAQRHVRGLGLVVRDITPEDVRTQNLPDRKGALVESVEAAGPAGQTGLKAGDVIVEAAGKPVESAAALVRIYAKLPAEKKQRVLVRYRRGVSLKLALIRAET
jgi:serine protease Do